MSGHSRKKVKVNGYINSQKDSSWKEPCKVPVLPLLLRAESSIHQKKTQIKKKKKTFS